MTRNLCLALFTFGACVAAVVAAASSAELKPSKRVEPEYPLAAANSGVQGCVVVSFIVLPDGRADQYQILDSVPKGLFDKAALKALNGWIFEQPPRKGRYAESIPFHIKGDANPIERPCKPVPDFETLNPAPGKR